MSIVNIRIEGVDRVIRKLGNVKGVDILITPMREVVLRLESDMKEYPIQDAESRYVRTGTLGRRWTNRVQMSNNGIIGTVGNNTEYAPWVQSRQFQAAVHRGRWQTAEDVLERRRTWIVNRFERAIRRAMERG